MPAPRKVNEEGESVVTQVAIARSRIPTDKELMTQLRISRQHLQRLLKKARKAIGGICHVSPTTETRET